MRAARAATPNPPDSFSLADIRFTDAEFGKLSLLGDAIYNANHPDLRAFAPAAHAGCLFIAPELVTRRWS